LIQIHESYGVDKGERLSKLVRTIVDLLDSGLLGTAPKSAWSTRRTGREPSLQAFAASCSSIRVFGRDYHSAAGR